MGEEKTQNTTEGIRPELRTLLVNMTFVGDCPENKKIYISGREYIPKNGWSYVNLKRNLWETGDTLIQFINEIITELKQFIGVGGTEGTEGTGRIQALIKEKIEIMIRGLNNLRDSYSESPGISSSLSVSISELELLK